MNLDDELKRWQAIRTVAPQAPRLGDTLAQSARQAPRRGNFLSDILGGLKEKASDIANTGLNIGRTIGGSLADKQHRVDMLQRESNSKKRNDEIARKYGYSSYNDAMNDENASQAFWDEIRAGADTEMKLAKERKQKQAKSAWNVQDIDLNKAKGQGLSTVASVLDLLPGVGSNVASGALEGVGQSFKDAQGGKDVDWEQASKNALVSSAGSLAGGMAGRKLGGVAGRGVLGRTASGALSGLASGATAGGLTAGLEGGDIYEGAKMGGLRGLQAGGTMAGLNALGAKALNVASGVRPDVDDVNLPKSGRKKARKALTDIERQDIADDIEDLQRARSEAQVKEQFGFQDVNARRENYAKSLPEAFRSLEEAGLKDRSQMVRAGKLIGGGEGTLSKARREVLSKVGKVNLKAEDSALNENTIKRIAKNHGLNAKETKDVLDHINSTVDSRVGDDLNGMLNGTVDALDADDIMKSIEKLSKGARKASSSESMATPKADTYDDLAKAIASDLDELSGEGFKAFAKDDANVQKIVEPIKERYPEYSQYVEKRLKGAKSLSEARNILQDLTIVGKADKNSQANVSSAPSTSSLYASEMANNPTLSPMGLLKNVGRATYKAVTPKGSKTYEKQINKLQKQLDVEPSAPRSNHQLVDLLTGIKRANAIGDPDARTNAGIKQAILEGGSFEHGDTSLRPFFNVDENKLLQIDGQGLKNMLKREIPITGANLASAGVSNLPRFAGRMAMQGTADDIRSGAITEEQAQAMMNEAQAMNEQQAMQEQQMPMQQPTPEAQPMGDMQEQLAMLSNAMGNALNAGDFQAYSQIAKMYGDAMDIMAMQAKLSGAGTPSGAGLSSEGQKQMAKLSSAENAINELESLYKNAGGAQGRLGGGIAELGAKIGLNSGVSGYNAMAEGLINQIAGAVGKTDALNNEGEVKRALALIPKISDTPEEAQIKLNSLRQMLKSNTQTFTDVYGR